MSERYHWEERTVSFFIKLFSQSLYLIIDLFYWIGLTRMMTVNQALQDAELD